MKDKRVHNVKMSNQKLGKGCSKSRLQPYQRVEFWEQNIKNMIHNSKEEERTWLLFLDKMKDDRAKGAIQWIRKT